MTTAELGLVVSATVAIIGIGWKLYDITIGRQKSDATQDIRLAGLEQAVEGLRTKLELVMLRTDEVQLLNVKMGLFWRLVEDNMGDLLAKANPINLTDPEQAAAHIYKDMKRHSPTDILKMLDKAIVREMPNLSADERASFSMIQSAIRAQLVDRHEFPYK